MMLVVVLALVEYVVALVERLEVEVVEVLLVNIVGAGGALADVAVMVVKLLGGYALDPAPVAPLAGIVVVGIDELLLGLVVELAGLLVVITGTLGAVVVTVVAPAAAAEVPAAELEVEALDVVVVLDNLGAVAFCECTTASWSAKRIHTL